MKQIIILSGLLILLMTLVSAVPIGNHLIFKFSSGDVTLNTSQLVGTKVSCDDIIGGDVPDYCVFVNVSSANASLKAYVDGNFPMKTDLSNNISNVNDSMKVYVDGNYYLRSVVNAILKSNLSDINQTIIHVWNTSWITANQRDTNASTACEDGEYLDGSGLCIKIASTYYNATNASVEAGTVAGTVKDTQHPDTKYDDVTFNFTEAAGSPGLDLRINFTNVSDFDRGVIRYKTSNLAGDFAIIQMWNYDNSVWEDYPSVGETETFATITQPVFDSSDHLQDGIAQMRIYKASNGNTNNHYYVDWIAIIKGFGSPSGEEIDPHFNIWLNNATLQSDMDSRGYTIYNVKVNGTVIGYPSDTDLANNITNVNTSIKNYIDYGFLMNGTDHTINNLNVTNITINDGCPIFSNGSHTCICSC